MVWGEGCWVLGRGIDFGHKIWLNASSFLEIFTVTSFKELLSCECAICAWRLVMGYTNNITLSVSSGGARRNYVQLLKGFRNRGRVIEVETDVLKFIRSKQSNKSAFSGEIVVAKSRSIHVFMKYFGHGWMPRHVREWQKSLGADGDSACLLATMASLPRHGRY